MCRVDEDCTGIWKGCPRVGVECGRRIGARGVVAAHPSVASLLVEHELCVKGADVGLHRGEANDVVQLAEDAVGAGRLVLIVGCAGHRVARAPVVKVFLCGARQRAEAAARASTAEGKAGRGGMIALPPFPLPLSSPHPLAATHA